MADTLRDVMTKDPTTLNADATLVEAARIMRDEDIGDLIILENGRLAGIVTDRDIVVRAVAEERTPDQTRVSQVYSSEVTTLPPDASIDEAVTVMREKALRRIPVVENDRPIGIVSIGDLAVEREPDSALAEISASDPNE